MAKEDSELPNQEVPVVARKKLRVVCPERKSKISDGKAHSFGFLIRNLADLMGKRIRISGFECPLVL